MENSFIVRPSDGPWISVEEFELLTGAGWADAQGLGNLILGFAYYELQARKSITLFYPLITVLGEPKADDFNEDSKLGFDYQQEIKQALSDFVQEVRQGSTTNYEIKRTITTSIGGSGGSTSTDNLSFSSNRSFLIPLRTKQRIDNLNLRTIARTILAEEVQSNGESILNAELEFYLA